MKPLKYSVKLALVLVAILGITGCMDLLDEPAENRIKTEETDYTISDNMILPLIGAYAEFQSNWAWELTPLFSVRGDDVNAGGLGDQQDYAETDKFNYNINFWMYNSAWQLLYYDIYIMHSAMEQVELYQKAGASAQLAEQYIAEIRTIRAWELFLLSRNWGDIFIPQTASQSELFVLPLSPKDEVMQHISDEMDLAIPGLPDLHPNERTDITGGVTKYTALAIKALANLELNEYQNVADATGEIISSGKFSLEPDFYELFKIPGKLNNENVFEMQYSDLGAGVGDNYGFTFAFFGPEVWTPKIAGSGGGWGFFEPSMKYIKFMLDRGETVRLETSVLFTNRGIGQIKSDPAYAVLPAWISNETRSGDVINDFPRAMFLSGKHYLPSDQLTPGRTEYGTNKNLSCIRYAEILLMYAEALTSGATGTVITADKAVNDIRLRAGLTTLTGVTKAQVMDEKFAELGMEWGIRYFDMVRLGEYDELSYDGRTFTAGEIFLPYPQTQVDKLPALSKN